MKRIARTVFLSLVAMLLVSSVAIADSNVTLAWDPSTSQDVVGVRIYQSNAAGQYQYGAANAVADIPAGTTQATINAVPDGTYYWVATAYDARGNESGPSNEVSTALDTIAPSAPGTLRVEVVVKVQVP